MLRWTRSAGIPLPEDVQTGSFSGACPQPTSPNATITAEEQKPSSKTFNAKPNALLDNQHTPLARVTGGGHTPLLKLAHRSEDQHLRPHNTPFELRYYTAAIVTVNGVLSLVGAEISYSIKSSVLGGETCSNSGNEWLRAVSILSS